MQRARFRSVLVLPALLVLLLLPLLALPALGQDGTSRIDRSVWVVVNDDLTLPADANAGVVVVVDGDAVIQGTAQLVVVVKGTLTMTSGSAAEQVVVVDAVADIQAGAIVEKDVIQARGTVTVDPAALIGGQVRGIEMDVAAASSVVFGAFAVIGLLALAAFALLTWFAGLALAAFGARQVRSAEWLISREPAKTFLAGLAMVFLPPIIAILLMVTVVLIPVGLVLLFVVWPVIAFIGWLVASTWIGEWILRTAGRDAPERRPYLGVTLGLIVATLASVVPLVGPVISLFGMGAVTLAGWRMLRAPRNPVPGPGGFVPVGG